MSTYMIILVAVSIFCETSKIKCAVNVQGIVGQSSGAS